MSEFDRIKKSIELDTKPAALAKSNDNQRKLLREKRIKQEYEKKKNEQLKKFAEKELE